MEPVERTVVRRVTALDGPRVRALRLRMLTDTPLAFIETLADAAAHPDAYWTDRAASRAAGCERAQFMADSGGDCVATAGGATYDDGHTWLVGVFVAPECRGTGMIEMLVAAVAEWSLGCGRDTLMLEVARENPRAVAAYRRLGFMPTGATSPHPLYPEITELEMSRPARW